MIGDSHTPLGEELRRTLGVSPEPQFELSLPDGWGRLDPTPESRAEFEKLLRRRFMQAQRPDLMAQSRHLLDRVFKIFEDERVIASFQPMDPEGKGALPVPASLLAKRRTAPAGKTLVDYLAYAMSKYKVEPLFGDKRWARFETEQTQVVDEQEVLVTSTYYVTPIPGTKRSRALEFVATFGRPPEVPRDDRRIEALHLMFDSTVSSLRWLAPEDQTLESQD